MTLCWPKSMKLNVPGSTAGTAFVGEQALAVPGCSLPFCVGPPLEATGRPVIVSKGAAAADSAPANIRAATTRPMRTYDGTTLRSKVAERKLAARRGELQLRLLRRAACQLGMLRAVRKTVLSLAAAAALLAWPATAA